MKLTLSAMALSALLVFSTPARASDLTLEFSVHTGDKTSTATEYMTRNKMRMADGDHDTIIDTAQGTITSIDRKKKEYSVMTAADMEAAMAGASEQMAAAQAQSQAAMKDMPPEMRKQMQSMMGGGAGGPMAELKITAVSGGRKIAGYDTQAFLMTMGETMQTRMWVTNALVPPLEPGQMLRLQSMMNPMMRNMGAAMAEFRKIKGLTLASQTSMSMMGRHMQSSREAVSVKLGPIPASVFAVPAGYKQVDSPLMRMGR